MPYRAPPGTHLIPHFERVLEERRTAAERRTMEEILARDGAADDPEAMERYFRVFFRPFFHDRTWGDDLVLGIDERWLAKYHTAGPRTNRAA